MEARHNHYMDNSYHPDCPRCKLNEAAPELLAVCSRAYFLLETNNIKDEYFEILRIGLGDLLPSQVVDQKQIEAIIAKCEKGSE